MTPDTELDRLFARPFPDIKPPVVPGLEVTEHRMDGLLLGNADIEINNHEAVYGICAQGDCDDE